MSVYDTIREGMAEDSRKARDYDRLMAELESTIRREKQEAANGHAWMEQCQAAERREQILRDVLSFYANEWVTNAEGDFSTPGLSRSWLEPTDALWNDAGRKAHSALQPSRDSVVAKEER